MAKTTNPILLILNEIKDFAKDTYNNKLLKQIEDIRYLYNMDKEIVSLANLLCFNPTNLCDEKLADFSNKIKNKIIVRKKDFGNFKKTTMI